MRRFLFSILILGFAITGSTDSVHAQELSTGVIEGRVVDIDTGEPLLGAHVFLSGTKIGTVTNRNGYFRLHSIGPGSHRLVVSIIGYGRIARNLSLGRGQELQQNIQLTPVVYELGEIYAGNLDERWERHLERFTRLFIGESSLSGMVEIKNPEVLRFETRWWGRFSAEALAPLEIENRALGYHITYYLEEFYHSGSRTRWDGEPLFTEMTPENEMQAQIWEENRRQAFNGSLRHFLISLIEDEVEQNGFSMFNIRRDAFGYSPQNKFRTSSRRLLRDTDEDHFMSLQFSGRLEIYYTREGEDPMYVRWAPDLFRAPAEFQTSYLELNRRRITVDPDGEIKEVYGATRFGYFAFHRIADKTPREYRPERF
jgi:hypothetical protein